jgi:phosphatidate cytidylyltransferase
LEVLAASGDLAVSALKRSRGKKDFMALLRLHGGVLDIYDSFLLAASAAFLLRPVLAA